MIRYDPPDEDVDVNRMINEFEEDQSYGTIQEVLAQDRAETKHFSSNVRNLKGSFQILLFWR